MAENQNTEWKAKWRDEYLKWICGFANAQGGTIYIGTDDDGTVVGLKNSRKLLEDIPNKIQTKLGIVADVNLLECNGLEYIEIVVSPCTFPVNCDGEYHYRSGSTKQQLKGNALTDFLMTKAGMKWDAATVSDISLDDLDKESFDIFRREALRSGRMTKKDLDISNEELLDKLELVNNGRLKRAAVLCFYRNPENIAGGCYVRIGRFEGSEILYQDEVHGSLMIMADRVIDLIYLKYLKAAITYHKDTRVETYPFAREAVREAVFNALIHCDWSDNVPIQIRVEEDEMYISNSSILPFGWTKENLLDTHISKPHNPDIARVFYRAGYIESWGRGIQKICDACKEIGAEEPEYMVHDTDIMVKFKALESARIKSKTHYDEEVLNQSLGDFLRETLDGIYGAKQTQSAYENFQNKIVSFLKVNPKPVQQALFRQLLALNQRQG